MTTRSSLSIDALESPALPHQKLGLLEIAERLDGPLKRILLEEISRGNRIREAGEDETTLWVSLIRPFGKAYRLKGAVVFTEETDPHYNSAMYSTTSGDKAHHLSAPYR